MATDIDPSPVSRVPTGEARRGEPTALDLSVVVCTYNRATLLAGTLAALGCQRVPEPVRWEIVVVDNNSTDDTRQVVEGFASTAPVQTRYVFEPRQGLSHARNTGIAACAGSIVAFTDDDITPEPDWVARAIAVMDADGADAIGGRVLPKWSAPPPPWLAADRTLLSLLAMQDSDQRARITSDGGLHIFGANMAFRREIFDSLGPFTTTLGRIGQQLGGGEDTELVARAVAAGRHVVYDPSLVVWHHVGAERMRKAYFRRWRFQAAELDAIHRGPVAGRQLFGIPAYLLRTLPARLASWLLACVTRDAAAFQKELALVANFGFLVGFAKRRRLPPSRPR